MAKKRNIYMVDGKRVPGVTTICGVIDKSGPLMHWSAKMAAEYIMENMKPDTPYSEPEIEDLADNAKKAHRVKKNAAGDYGNEVHAIVEAYIGGQLLPKDLSDEHEKRALDNFMKETDEYEWIAAEIITLNHKLKYGGTADGIAIINGEHVLVDVKTSNTVQPTYDLQLTMYKMATPEDERLREDWSKIEKGVILHFDKERGTWETLDRILTPLEEYVPGLVKTYEWNKLYNQR